jgi:FtsP/CotA-like multicopper oxidase with cupredoxin domain
MLQPIRRAFIVTAVAVSAFVCLETPAVAQDTSPASNAEVYAGTNVTHATATVVDIEVATNSVTLRGSHGDPVDVEVMKNVGDVKRLKIGDNVNITNTRALLVHADKVDSKGIRESIDTETTMPASGGTTMSVHRAQVIATVESIDATQRGMTLRGPTNSVTLVASASLPLVELKVGDSIRVDYTESTAVQVTRDGAPLQ